MGRQEAVELFQEAFARSAVVESCGLFPIGRSGQSFCSDYDRGAAKKGRDFSTLGAGT